MGLAVLVMNPSGKVKRKGKRMARKKFSWADTGLLALGAVAVAGGAFAIDAFDIPKLATGAIKIGTGVLVGGGISMVNRPIGAGVAGGGIALGTYDVAGEALGGLAKAAPGAAEETTAIRADLGRAELGRTHRRRKTLPAGMPRGSVDISQTANNLRAIVSKLPGGRRAA